jgi:hypothetical protein
MEEGFIANDEVNNSTRDEMAFSLGESEAAK